MVLASVTSPHSRRNYAKALDLLFAFAGGRPLTRALLMEYRASMDALAPSTVNVRLAAIRKLITEARKNGMLSAEEATNLTDVPNVRQKGTRLGNWLTREQARELLAVPDRSTLKGKRDYAILLRSAGRVRPPEKGTGVALYRGPPDAGEPLGDRRPSRQGRPHPHRRRPGLGEERDGGLDGRRQDRARGRCCVRITKAGKVGESLSDWAIWAVVTAAAREIGIERFGAHDLRRTCAKLCRKAGGDLEQIKFLLGHSSIQTTERYLGSEQEIAIAVNDSLGL